MDRAEIETRLDQGEEPIDLTIEHWERNLERVRNDQLLLLGGFHCALCVWHGSVCGECPLALFETMDCGHSQSSYIKVINLYHDEDCGKNELEEVVQNMLDTLKRIRTEAT